MGLLPTIAAAMCLYALPVLASATVSSEDSERMRMETLADSASQHIQGRSDMLPAEEDEESPDRTTGSSDDECANVFVRTEREDGQTVIDRVNVCD
jgi:hypothetical protein